METQGSLGGWLSNALTSLKLTESTKADALSRGAPAATVGSKATASSAVHAEGAVDKASQSLNARPASTMPTAPEEVVTRHTAASSIAPGGHQVVETGDADAAAASAQADEEKEEVMVKVGMVGDAQIGKTSLMVKYVEGAFDEDYIQTLGVNFMEKTVSIRNAHITFSIWDLGGQREFLNMLPLVCNDAAAILFMFDLSRIETLNSVKEWYRQARGLNKTAVAILVGTKYDIFASLGAQEQGEVTKQARRFAKAMKAPLVFSSASHSINIQKVFKILLSRVFDLKCNVPQITNVGEPILEY